MPVLALLAFFPYAAMLVRRSPMEAPWAFLDPGGRLRTPPLGRRPLLPLLIGATAGLGFLVLAALVRLGMHYGVSAETRALDATLLSFFVSMVALAILVQLVAGAAPRVATGAGRRARRVVRRRLLRLARHRRRPDGRWLRRLRSRSTRGPAPGQSTRRSHGTSSSRWWPQGAIAGLAGGLVAVGVHALVHRRRSEELRPAGVAP